MAAQYVHPSPLSAEEVQRLIDELEKDIDDAARKASDAGSHEQAVYWRGVLFGLEMALDALADRAGVELVRDQQKGSTT